MKKTAITISLCVLTAGLLSGAPTLKLIAPNGGEVLTLGSDFQITWTASEVNQDVRLVLFRNNRRVGLIADNLKVDSSPFRWRIGQHAGGSAAPGDGYKIYIRTIVDALEDFSDKPFTLAGSVSPRPDFEVSHMGCTPRVSNGAVQRVDVQIYVKNNGADYQGPLSVHYICLDSLVHPRISLDEVVSRPSVSIPHGQWYGFPLCQPAIPAGVESISLGIQLDPDNLVQETSETNNHFNYTYTIPPLNEIDPR